jgi:hypothetical protein
LEVDNLTSDNLAVDKVEEKTGGSMATNAPQGQTIRVQIPPGVDVMITIFYDFRQFSAKIIGVFLKTQ